MSTGPAKTPPTSGGTKIVFVALLFGGRSGLFSWRTLQRCTFPAAGYLAWMGNPS